LLEKAQLKTCCKLAASFLPFALPICAPNRPVHDLLTAVWHDSVTFNQPPFTLIDKEIVMQTKCLTPPRQLPNYPTRFALGLLILLLTLLLIVTAIAPVFSHFLAEEDCAGVATQTINGFSAETAVPNCWLIQ
jgi:hypothetical protein